MSALPGLPGQTFERSSYRSPVTRIAPANAMTFVRYRTKRSPGATSSAWLRRRSLNPKTSKPRAAVAAWFSGEAVRIQVRTRQIFSGDRDVLDLGLVAARAALELVDEPVDQRAQDEQQLAHELGDLGAQLGRQDVAQRLQQRDQRLH